MNEYKTSAKCKAFLSNTNSIIQQQQQMERSWFKSPFKRITFRPPNHIKSSLYNISDIASFSTRNLLVLYSIILVVFSFWCTNMYSLELADFVKSTEREVTWRKRNRFELNEIAYVKLPHISFLSIHQIGELKRIHTFLLMYSFSSKLVLIYSVFTQLMYSYFHPGG